MTPVTLFLLFFVSNCDCLSIGVKENNVTKREANGDFFPNWVPFKNKHGEELGEFIDVPKPKPKKRLAPPMNFILKVDDDEDIEQVVRDGSDNEDYYDKKQWSDVNRPAADVIPKNISYSDIAGIDNIVNIITKPSDNILLQPPNARISRTGRKQSDELGKFNENIEDYSDKGENSDHVNGKEERKIGHGGRKGNNKASDDNSENDNNKKEKTDQKNNNNDNNEVKDDYYYEDDDDKEENVNKGPTNVKLLENQSLKGDEEEDNSQRKEKRNNVDIKNTEVVEEDINDSKEKEENEKEGNNGSKDKEENEKEEVDDSKEKEEKEKEDRKAKELLELQRKEDEYKKARILSLVDDLKERHAKEQRIISEKVKEEELFREERNQDRYQSDEDDDKYHPHYRSNLKNEPIADDEYEDDYVVSDKYKIKPYKSMITTTVTTTTTSTMKPTVSLKRKNRKRTESTGKLSVFRNPHLYMVEEDVEKTTTVRSINTKKPKRFSARYSASSSPAPEEESNVRISLVPQEADLKNGEPALFFPRVIKKNARKLKIKTTPEPINSNEGEDDTNDIVQPPTVTSLSDTSSSASDPFSSVSNTAPSAPETSSTADTSASTLTTDTTAYDTAPSASGSAPSGSDTTPTASDTTDSALASTNKKEEKKNEDYHVEKGGGKQHHSEHEEEHEEHGKKAYEGIHKETKTNKGHHDKASHHDKYDDVAGSDKKHHEEDGHYGAHHHEEHGKKFAKYEESGKHSKGHSTKGSHDIHKKDEYEKKVEFFEEEGDSDEEEMHGGHHGEKGHSSGGNFKKGNLNAGHKGHEKGETGHFAKSGYGHINKGHRSSGGHDGHGKHGGNHFHKEGKESGKKWIFHHGHPAKTANLVVIDRRADGYQMGPRYFGY